MITNNDLNKQLPNELNAIFKELKVLQHLRNASITKAFSFSSGYLFQLIFGLISEIRTGLEHLKATKSHDFPAKDTVYRFMNHSTFNWRKFLLNLNSYTIGKVTKLTNHQRPKILIWDDSSYDRNLSKSVELLARCFDYASQKMRHYKVFVYLNSVGPTEHLYPCKFLSTKFKE